MWSDIRQSMMEAAAYLEAAAPFTPKGTPEWRLRDMATELRRHSKTLASHESTHADHLSYHQDRLTEHNPRERVFAEKWKHENTREGFSTPLLVALLTRSKSPTIAARPHDDREWIDGPMSKRDGHVAATVVQWLGTNVGMTFLEEALTQCGYKLVRENHDAVR